MSALPSVTCVTTPVAEIESDLLAVGAFAVEDSTEVRLTAAGVALDEAMDGKLVQAVTDLRASGSVGSVTRIPTLGAVPTSVILVVGLGRSDTPSTEVLRRAGGSAAAAAAGRESLTLALAEGDDPQLYAASVEGAVLRSYEFTRYKSDLPSTHRSPVASVSVRTPAALREEMETQLPRVSIAAAAVHQARDWVNMPGADLRPEAFAREVAEKAEAVGLSVEVLGPEELRTGGYGGLLAVGSGSAVGPRLVILRYIPEGEPSSTLALVGKGITFDTGGISLKPPQGMWDMKTDMGGAAAVMSTMLAVAQYKPSVAITAYVPLAENMPSGTAYRPGDVVTLYGGTTVEILNTDAEGRIVLGDALARASEEEPDRLINVATLTGGQVTALGKRTAGVMGSEEFVRHVCETGERTGEPMWGMPIPEDIESLMESSIADISQVASGMNKAGHMLQGGAFIRHQIAEGIEWAHIDIAGPSYTDAAHYYTPQGGTGVPVRTLLSLVENESVQA